MPKFNRYRRRATFRPPRAKPLSFRYVFLLTIVFFTLSSAIGFWMVNIGIKPALTAFAESQSVNLATNIIDDAIREQIGEGLSLDEITKTIPYERSELTTFDADKILHIQTDISQSILANINEVEEGKIYTTNILENGEIEQVELHHGEGIMFEIPLGRITDNVLLGSVGPNIPVKFHAIGDIEHNVETVKEALQINSTWFEIRLKVKVGIQIIVPFTTKMKFIQRDILLAAGEIRGDVPQFYSNGSGFMPSFSVPVEDNHDEQE